MIGGHTNFIVNQTSTAKVMAWPNRVALTFTVRPSQI
jgi:hypothetical protein